MIEINYDQPAIRMQQDFIFWMAVCRSSGANNQEERRDDPVEMFG